MTRDVKNQTFMEFMSKPKIKRRFRGAKHSRTIYSGFPELNKKEFREAFEKWYELKLEQNAKPTTESLFKQLQTLNSWGRKRSIIAINKALEIDSSELFYPKDK